MKYLGLIITTLALQLSVGVACDLLTTDIYTDAKEFANKSSSVVKAEKLERAKQYEKDGKLQEAIWEYSWAGEEEKANELKKKLEKILREKPVRIKFLGSGSSMSFKAYFADGTKALFKINDPELKGESDVNAEFAAYAVEQELNLNIMPMVLKRKMNIPASIIPEEFRKRFKGGNVTGSISYWVNDVEGPNLKNAKLISDDFGFFDQLILNWDRGGRNYLVRTDNNHVVAIDHDRTFIDVSQYPTLKSDRFEKPGPQVLERLRNTPEKRWRELLSPHLSKAKVEQFLGRRQAFLNPDNPPKGVLVFSR